MRALPLLLLLTAAAFAETAEQGSLADIPLTLDPAVYAEALQEVRGQAAAPVAKELPLQGHSTAPDVADWQAAMRDAGTELGDVRLLVLLQRLNPQSPLTLRAEDYAEVLRLHHLMLAGNPRACASLGRAMLEGRFENGLLFIESESMGQQLLRRSQVFQLPAELPELPAR